MFTPLFAMLLSGSVAMPEQFSLQPNQPQRCSGACAERYRIPASSRNDDDVKGRALAADGTECNVVGSRYCLSKRRVLWRSSDTSRFQSLKQSFGLLNR